MKTKVLPTNNSSFSFKIIGILFILALNASNMCSQTIKSVENCPKLLPVVHYVQKTKPANKSLVVKVYTILSAKNFPIIESGEKQVLVAMDDREDFNYEVLFLSKVNVQTARSTDNASLALNYKIQKPDLS